jgi:hypothetical protein
MPGLMSEYPGLLPWHFGGDPYLTYREIGAIARNFDERMTERKRQAKDASKHSRR